MTKQQAVEFINAVNAIQPFVPPILFGGLVNSELARMAVAVADEPVPDVRPGAATKSNGAIQDAPRP